MQAPELALKELERAARLPGMRGLYLATNVNGAELDEPSFWDIYARCEELRWTIFLHPVDTVGQDRTRKYYLKNLCGNPYDTGIAAAHLIFGGVLDAFPKLVFNLPHAGGTMPGLIGRWDHGAKVRARAEAHEAAAEPNTCGASPTTPSATTTASTRTSCGWSAPTASRSAATTASIWGWTTRSPP